MERYHKLRALLFQPVPVTAVRAAYVCLSIRNARGEILISIGASCFQHKNKRLFAAFFSLHSGHSYGSNCLAHTKINITLYGVTQILRPEQNPDSHAG